MQNLKTYAIILASGKGSRYGSSIPKQFEKIDKYTILEHSINAFENVAQIDDIIVIITPEYRDLAEKILSQNNYKKITKLLNGGETRKDSSFIAINSIDEEEANILIHDCARPLISEKIIKSCIEALSSCQAVTTAIKVTDTIVKISNNKIECIPSRESLMRVQTPQCFKLSIIKKAHELSKNDSNFTDDCGLVLKHNLTDIKIVEGDEENLKITYPNDLLTAETIYKKRNSNK